MWFQRLEALFLIDVFILLYDSSDKLKVNICLDTKDKNFHKSDNYKFSERNSLSSNIEIYEWIEKKLSSSGTLQKS